MSGINVCATFGSNLGVPACDVRMGRIKYLILTTSAEMTEADLATSESVQEWMADALVLANSDANKLFAFPFMREATDNTGDPQLGTLADGYEEVLNEAVPKYLLRSTPGFCVQAAMSSFNGWPGKMYIVDENNVFWYKSKTTAAGVPNGGKGWTTAYLYTQPPKFKGSGEVATANTRVTFVINEFKGAVGAVKLEFEVSDLDNLKDVTLKDLEDENASGALNNAFLIGGNVKCEGTDIYAAYADLLNTSNAWRAYTSDGTAIALTSVAKNDTEGGWDIVLNSGEYSALASGTVFYIDLQTPPVLAALATPVTGIEATKLRFVKF